MFAVEITDMSGWQQSPGEIRTPSSLEIAIVTGRICRYAGNLPCSLLTHIMVGARVVWHLLQQTGAVEGERLQTFCCWMLHDSHEVITGDFAPHKCDELKKWQKDIDDAVAVVYGIDFEHVDLDLIHGADLLARWLEARFYGSDAFFKTFEEHHEYDVPSPAMVRETGGVFRSDFGRLSCCITDENDNPGLSGPIVTYTNILEMILRGEQKGAVEFYDGMVVELGLD